MKTIQHIAALTAATLALAIGQPAQARTTSDYIDRVFELLQEEALKTQIRAYCSEEMYTFGGYVACVEVLYEKYGRCRSRSTNAKRSSASSASPI